MSLAEVLWTFSSAFCYWCRVRIQSKVWLLFYELSRQSLVCPLSLGVFSFLYDALNVGVEELFVYVISREGRTCSIHPGYPLPCMSRTLSFFWWRRPAFCCPTSSLTIHVCSCLYFFVRFFFTDGGGAKRLRGGQLHPALHSQG